MNELPQGLSVHVGQDVSTGYLLRRSFQSFRRKFWRMLLLGLALGGVWIIVGFVVGSIFSCCGSVTYVPVRGLVVLPLVAGMLWTAVCAFEDRPVRSGDLRYKPLALLGLLQAGVEILVMLGLSVVVLAFGAGAATRSGPIPLLAGGMVLVIVMLLIHLALQTAISSLFFVAYPYAFVHRDATVWQCLTHNWRVLKARTPQFLVALALPYGLMLAAWLVGGILFVGGQAAVAFAGYDGSATAAKAVAIASGLIGLGGSAVGWIYGLFLRAGFFRASYGYTIDPVKPVPRAAAEDDAVGRA